MPFTSRHAALLVSFSLGVGARAQAPQPSALPIPIVYSHGSLVAKALIAVREPDLSVGKLGTFSSDQAARVIDRFFEQYSHALTQAKIIEAQNDQGGTVQLPDDLQEFQHVQIRNIELFPALGDDVLFPLTESGIVYAPESTFVGVTLYTQKGKPLGQIVGKSKTWHSGVTSNDGRIRNGSSYFRTNVTDEQGHVMADGSTILYVRWADVKSKIAFDSTQKKIEQDHSLEVAALGK